MYAGKLMKITIRFTGNNPEAVLNRLPVTRIVLKEEQGWMIETEVYGKGILMWLFN